MASYSIVLAPIAALMAFDFFIIKREKLDIYELYKPRGIYRFARGWNWRAYVALGVAVVPNLPGMINAIEPRVRVHPNFSVARRKADMLRSRSAISATSTCSQTSAATL